MKASFLAALGIASLLSGSPGAQPTNEAYPDDYGRLYTAYVKTILSMPATRSGMSEEERLAVISSYLLHQANTYEAFAEELAAQTPPGRFGDLHTQTLELYRMRASLLRQWSKAVSNDNRFECDRISEKIDSRALRQDERVTVEIQCLQREDPGLGKRLILIQ